MNPTLRSAMLEATRLTRAGSPGEATALLQDALGQHALGQDALGGGPLGVAGESLNEPAGHLALPAPQVAARSGAPRRPAAATRAPEGLGRSLGEVLARLKKVARSGSPGGWQGRPQPRPVELPDGARFLERTFTNRCGTRAFKLYVPACYRDRALPLVVMLHGCTQSPDDFAAGTRMNQLAEEHGCLVLYPAQDAAANASRCWNWFSPAHQGRDRGEPAIIAGMTRQVVQEFGLDERRVYVAGLSAGGAMALIMGMTWPDLFAATGVHSGLAFEAANDLPSAFAAMRDGAPAARPGRTPRPRRIVPTIVFHGDGDGTVHPRNGDQIIEAWQRVMSADGGAPAPLVESGRAEGGHGYTRTRSRDAGGRVVLEQWLVHGAGHAWSGGSPAGSYTEPKGPDAARAMLRFFYEHPMAAAAG